MKINYILTLILVFCIGASIPILTGSSQVNEQHSAKSEVPYCVTPPTVPAQVTFDGETIDLRRYDRRERMDREMMAFTYMHSTTMLLIKRANRYFPIIEPILKANGIPDDFKYLMVIESNLNNIARSPAGAAGLWQFMPATGLGKFLSACVMLIGYTIIAVPTGIVSASMMKEYKRRRDKECPNCHRSGHEDNAEFCKYCGHSLNPSETKAEEK